MHAHHCPCNMHAYHCPSTAHRVQVIYVETMSNPLLAVPDLPAVVAFASRHGLTSIIDNTFGTPVNFRPLHHGFDVVLHSATKYLNGHSDVIAGAVAASADLIGKVGRPHRPLD